MERSRPRQHRRRLPSGKVITVNKGRRKVKIRRMPILFHGTKKKHLKSILSQGLLPNSNDEDAVFLTAGEPVAESFAVRGSEEKDHKRFFEKIEVLKEEAKARGQKFPAPEDIVKALQESRDKSPGIILTVDVPKKALTESDTDKGFEVLHKGKIKPSQIINWREI